MPPPSPSVFAQAEPQLAATADELQAALGHPGEIPMLGRCLALRHPHPIRNPASLRDFLLHYRDSRLLPIELPAIRQAYHHAARYEVRELLAFDRQLRHAPAAPELAFASQVIGQRYLRRLRPLRDVRLIRRYLLAIQQGQACGWHTLVYGSVLTIYSIPLRQGLLGYASQTLTGFLDAAASRFTLLPRNRLEMLQETAATIPATVNRLLADQPTARLVPE
jgi:urease accessory protein UreF